MTVQPREFAPIRRRRREEPPATDDAAEVTEPVATDNLIESIDDLLDEIDSVLEEQSVLVNFRQRSGQ
jgi:Pup-like protein